MIAGKEARWPGPPAAAAHDATPGSASLAPGVSLLGGRFKLLSPMGRGPNGTVWKARHQRLHTHVAIKVLRGLTVFEEHALERYARDAAMAAQWCGDHGTSIFDSGRGPSGEGLLVTDLLEGVDLARRLSPSIPLPLEEVVHLAWQATRGLEGAHCHGLAHGRIKPTNLFLSLADEQTTLRFLDFGVHHLEGGPSASPYLAPELGRGAAITADADIYSLGMILVQALTGEAPIAATEPEGPHPWVHHLAGSSACATPALTYWTRRALAPAPDLRYRSVQELVAELQEALTSSPGSRRHEGTATALRAAVAAPAGARGSAPPSDTPQAGMTSYADADDSMPPPPLSGTPTGVRYPTQTLLRHPSTDDVILEALARLLETYLGAKAEPIVRLELQHGPTRPGGVLPTDLLQRLERHIPTSSHRHAFSTAARAALRRLDVHSISPGA